MGDIKEINVETDLKGNYVSTVKANINGKTLKLSHKFPSGIIGLESTFKRWTIGYDHPSRDVAIEYKKPVKWGQLSIKQRVPQSRYFLVPSPELKLTANPLNKSKFRDELQVSYDFQKRVAKVEEEVTYRGKYKAKVTADSNTKAKGATLALTAKLGKPWATSLGCNLSRFGGPVLKYEADVGKDALKAKADLLVKQKAVKVELSPKPIKKVRLTLTTTVKSDKVKSPTFLLGAKFEP